MEETQQMLDVRQVAAMTGQSVRTVWRRSGKGEMPRPVHLGSLARWSRARVQEWLDEKQQGIDTSEHEARRVVAEIGHG